MTDACDDERRAQMFPVLTDAQIARAELHATRRSLAAGETTFELGTADPGIHIVLSGALEVIGPWAAGDDLVTVLSAGQFTGEVSSRFGHVAGSLGSMATTACAPFDGVPRPARSRREGSSTSSS